MHLPLSRFATFLKHDKQEVDRCNFSYHEDIMQGLPYTEESQTFNLHATVIPRYLI